MRACFGTGVARTSRLGSQEDVMETMLCEADGERDDDGFLTEQLRR